jgi:hypothetical protein
MATQMIFYEEYSNNKFCPFFSNFFLSSNSTATIITISTHTALSGATKQCTKKSCTLLLSVRIHL